MVKLTEIGVQLHIFQEVIHPAHVPFQGKSKAVILCLTCNLRPCGRLLCNHHSTMVSSKNHCIQMLKKLNCFQILISAIFIGYPLTIILSIIQIQHGCNGIHTKTVHMTLLDPEQSICDQEVLYLRSAIIVDLGSPVRMLSLSGICMLINCSSVKIRQSMGILGKMCRHPVQNNPDFLSVKIIYQIFEILGCSIAGSRRIITGDLISPGTVKGMLCNPHQLHMCIAHILHILGKLHRQFPVIEKAFLILLCRRMLHPGARMYLIDRHGILSLVKFLTILHPGGIFPFVIPDIRDSGCRSRS